METSSEGDPVPLGIFLQLTADNYIPTSFINTGLFLLVGLILCSAFLTFLISVLSQALQFSSQQEPGQPNPAQQSKYISYFWSRNHHLHSTAFFIHALLATLMLAAGIFWLSYIYPVITTGWLWLLPVLILLLYVLVVALSQLVAAQATSVKISNYAAQALFYICKFSLPLQGILGRILHYHEPETEAAAQNPTLRDLFAQNGTTPTALEERKILRGIVNFSNIYVKQIMRPRTEVVAHDIAMPFARLCRLINENRYSRIPVYEGSLDKVKGVLYVKDLLPYINQKADFAWQNLIREPYFVPETQKIDLLLQEFKRKKVHLAIVVDEYGGTSGIITLEDILEEIVGDIRDEFDEDEINYSKLDINNYLFEGKTPLTDVIRIMNLESGVFDDVRGDAETLGGLIIEILGSIPQPGEKIYHHNFCFTVETADGRRVRRVKITRQEVNEPEFQP